MKLRYIFAVVLLTGGTVIYVDLTWIMFSAILRSIAEKLYLLGV
jgi:hypothetical protein